MPPKKGNKGKTKGGNGAKKPTQTQDQPQSQQEPAPQPAPDPQAQQHNRMGPIPDEYSKHETMHFSSKPPHRSSKPYFWTYMCCFLSVCAEMLLKCYTQDQCTAEIDEHCKDPEYNIALDLNVLSGKLKKKREK